MGTGATEPIATEVLRTVMHRAKRKVEVRVGTEASAGLILHNSRHLPAEEPGLATRRRGRTMAAVQMEEAQVGPVMVKPPSKSKRC